MVSYGIALIIIIIAVAIIYKVGVLSPNLAQPSCTAMPGFACGAFAISANGMLSLQLFQATGGTITVYGVACSAAYNGTGNRPAFGNIYVTNSISYYPASSSPGTGINMYSGSGYTFNSICYASKGVNYNQLGGGDFGYVWLNYTVPGYGSVTQIVASVTARVT